MTFNILTLSIEKWIPFEGATISNNHFYCLFQNAAPHFTFLSHSNTHTHFVFGTMICRIFTFELCKTLSARFRLARTTESESKNATNIYPIVQCKSTHSIGSKIRKRHIERSWVGTFEMLNGNDNRLHFSTTMIWNHGNILINITQELRARLKAISFSRKTWNSHLRPTAAA